MNDILALVQTTLDTLLSADHVYSFWGRRAEIASKNPATEYIIYSIDGDNAEVCADGGTIFRMMTISLQYYVKYSIARTSTGRKAATDRMDTIREAMRSAGFGCSDGWSEIGDVDEVGFATFRSVYDIPRLMDGE